MRPKPRSLAVLLVLAAAVAGCARLAEDIATQVVRHDLRTVEEDFTVIEGDLALFRRCLKERGGDCEGDAATALPGSSQARNSTAVGAVSPGGSRALADSVAALPAGDPAKIAYGVLRHPVVRQAAAVHDHLRGQSTGPVAGVGVEQGQGESTVTLGLKLDQTADFHSRLLGSLGNRSWDALHDHCQKLQAQPGFAEHEAGCRQAAFVRGYLDAYLGHGELVEVDVELAVLIRAVDDEAAKAESQIEKLRDKIAELDKKLDAGVERQLQKADAELSNVFKVSNVGFVSRDTTFAARLPSLRVTVDPTARRLLDVTDEDAGGQLLTSRSDFADLGVATDTSGVGTGANIGAELVRVFLEALFDAHEGLPGVAPLNGPRATGLTLGAYALPLFQSPTGNVDGKDLGRMRDFDDQVALRTRLIVGRVISGIGPFSLDNPPLEDLITEIVATSVRKAVEKASWCWFACNLDVELAKLRADVDKTVDDTGKAIEDEAKSEVEAGEAKAGSWLDREAERVRLRLRLDG
jgi:hypothetical protein